MKSRKLVLLTRLIISITVSLTTGAIVALATNDVWEIHLPTNHTTLSDNVLYSVSAYDSSNVWAVGSYDTINGFLPLIEKWGGSSWTEQTSNGATSNSELFGVAALSSSKVWAVGNNGSGDKAGTWPWEPQPTTAGYTYAEFTSDGGSTWKRNTTTLSPGSGFNTFRSTCFNSSNDGWAVGYYNNNGAASRTLAEYWDGTQWNIVNPPNPGTNNYLYGVACVATNDVWAVGNADGNATLIFHYNGTSWSQATSPSPGTYLNYLDGVACYSSSECFAVGEYYNTGSVAKSLIIHYNGTSWSTVSSPNSGTGSNALASVAYVGASNWAWAVGFYNNPPNKTNILRWNGTSWSTATSPNQGTANNRLHGVTTIPGSGVCAGGGSWAVGQYLNGSYYQTLAESYTITPSCRP